MRIRVIDGVPHVESVYTKTRTGGGLSEHTEWRPLDDRPEDREAREAWEWLRMHTHHPPVTMASGLPVSPTKIPPDGLYELEHDYGGDDCQGHTERWPTLRRVEE